MPKRSLFNSIRSKGSRLLLHLLFWLGVTAFLSLFFGHAGKDFRSTFLFVCLLIPIAVATTYFINYFLVPRYLLRKRYARFSAYFIFTLVFSVWGEMMVMMLTFIFLADYRYQNMNPLTGNIIFLVVALYFVVFFSTSVKMLKHWYSSEKDISELRSRQLEAELKLKEAELQLLKGQIHPHFLFNTLNNLYGLALENSEQMPDAIIRLSGLLDALLYRSQDKKIPLLAELKLIEDYIALEKLRVDERLQLDWNITKRMEGYSIAPFLLFPFIENAFKHGFAGHTEKLWLEIKMELKGQELLFSASNTVSSPEPEKKSGGGIGLQNVKRRLELLYPGRHQLYIQHQSNKFTVKLSITLSTAKIPEHAYENN